MTARQCFLLAPLSYLLTSCAPGNGGHCFDAVPTNHRPAHVTCDGDDAGLCKQDSDCALLDAGQLVCSCAPHGANGGADLFSRENVCLAGDCLTDADCA